MESPNKLEISEWLKSLQDDICKSLEQLDGTSFQQDLWRRPGGGGGRSRVITGNVIEKGGVNFSAVEGSLPVKICNALGIPPSDFFATGVSIVLHPHHPMVPIIHMNVRYFETSDGQYWFGGGIDVTPHYIFADDAFGFHTALKKVCDKHDKFYYDEFKNWADDYFFIKHRNETRGVGGIFFDRLATDETHNKAERFAFLQDVGRSFVPCYKALVAQNIEKDFTDKHKDWQYHRRGRYVEFNLVWDKGTKFGLDTDGRTESILMSMPPMAKWTYQHVIHPNSPEEKTLKLLKKGIDWVNHTEG